MTSAANADVHRVASGRCALPLLDARYSLPPRNELLLLGKGFLEIDGHQLDAFELRQSLRFASSLKVGTMAVSLAFVMVISYITCSDSLNRIGSRGSVEHLIPLENG